MPSLLRFAVFHFATGMAIGIAIAAVLLFGESGMMSALEDPGDRLLVFVILAVNLGGTFGIACLGTAFCFAGDDD